MIREWMAVLSATGIQGKLCGTCVQCMRRRQRALTRQGVSSGAKASEAPLWRMSAQSVGQMCDRQTALPLGPWPPSPDMRCWVRWCHCCCPKPPQCRCCHADAAAVAGTPCCSEAGGVTRHTDARCHREDSLNSCVKATRRCRTHLSTQLPTCLPGRLHPSMRTCANGSGGKAAADADVAGGGGRCSSGDQSAPTYRRRSR